MKKILSVCMVLCTLLCVYAPASYAVNIGTYKTETEYGLLDGFKFNWKRQDKSKPFIEPRDASTKQELEKEYRDYKETEYERTKFLYEGKSII